jgi:hypothetical protein
VTRRLNFFYQHNLVSSSGNRNQLSVHISTHAMVTGLSRESEITGVNASARIYRETSVRDRTMSRALIVLQCKFRLPGCLHDELWPILNLTEGDRQKGDLLELPCLGSAHDVVDGKTPEYWN